MHVIAIANQKGGVGKTTTAVNLAASLAYLGRKTLLVDLDAQASATNWIGVQPEEGRTVYQVLTKKISASDCILPTEFGCDLLPADISLATLDVDLLSEVRREDRLQSALSKLRGYNVALVDTPPNLALTTINGLAAATEIVIPIQCNTEAWRAVGRLIDTLRNLFEALDRITIARALPTFLDRTVLARQVYEQITEQFETLTLSPIHRNVRLAEACAQQKPILAYDRTAVGCADYLRVSKEIINVIEKPEASVRETAFN